MEIVILKSTFFREVVFNFNEYIYNIHDSTRVEPGVLILMNN